MRYAILADIHGNLDAFEAVLRDIDEKGGADELWCLGDVVGYGPDPAECIALLRRHPHICVAGNHDWAAIGKIDISDFNPHAAAACRWTSGRLADGDVAYLENLPLRLERGDFTIVHGSPREPIWEYVMSVHEAEANFDCFATSYCLIGHSHVPAVFELSDDSCSIGEMKTLLKLGEHRLIVNCGSVGQPRDGDPRASYAIYDAVEQVIYHNRVQYDVACVQQRMVSLGLPQFLAERLGHGW
jgi:diadenosine tetraphosphatase ApaH/serine/threonine PP2A family protein phosphatase